MKIERTAARPSDHLHDHTAIDGYVEVERKNGQGDVVAIETKLADAFSSRWLHISERPAYASANRRFQLWDTAHPEFGSKQTEQLARVHMLASSLGGVPAKLIVIYHPLDQRTPKIVERYRQTLNTSTQLIAVTLSEAVAALGLSGLERATVEKLRLRYLDFAQSDHRLADFNWGQEARGSGT